MSSVTTGSSSYAAVLLVLLLTVTQCGNSKFPNLGCQKLWTTRSAQNDPLTCIKDKTRILSHWEDILLPVLAGLLLALIVVIFPLTFFSTCLCSSCCKPSSKDRGRKQRCCLWMWIAFAFIWAFGVAVFVLFGAQQLKITLDDLLSHRVNRPLNSLRCTADKILGLAYDWRTGEPLREGIGRETIDSTVDMARSYIAMAKGYYDQYVHWVPTVSFCIGAFAVLVMVPMFMFAYFRCCSKWLPRLLSCVYWLFAILFTALGLVILLLAYAFGLVCGEITLHYDRSPGLIQLYALPMCEEKFNFANLNKMILDAQKDVSQKACEEILKYCDNDTSQLGDITGVGGVAALLGRNLPPGLDPKFLPPGVKAEDLEDEKGLDSLLESHIPGVNDKEKIPRRYEGSVPPDGSLPGNMRDVIGARTTQFPQLPFGPSNKMLTCGQGVGSKEECSTFGFTAAVISGTKVKGGYMVCPDKGRPCSLQVCADRCRLPEAKDIAHKLAVAAQLAVNVSIGLSIGRPLLECNFIFDTLLTALPNCDGLYWGTMMLGLGFFLGGMMFALSIYILLRGSCVWSDLKRWDEDEEKDSENKRESDKRPARK
ncbi:hypothetical protein, conserved [Trypanosoma brucei gambiense DAL972]|uniref:Uncharacterized protein n=1 Tax=Trypanosoma brucei gambiense (strain MHOM/CI/86/DAL972) TaxID=679716 RepID=C9ZWF7_TRYB9|nr:hypothetical protein, conserved [Trypanosoma brucei gambiense DAL972]CBH13746.1 hypothetical protein, conserved [Trypanosoma brucei gambiense DAL972]|eukprot:XP_011776022.1 hypothetical protein, conserved [Trypanosoma brucei gambiense DAL972]